MPNVTQYTAVACGCLVEVTSWQQGEYVTERWCEGMQALNQWSRAIAHARHQWASGRADDHGWEDEYLPHDAADCWSCEVTLKLNAAREAVNALAAAHMSAIRRELQQGGRESQWPVSVLDS